MNRTFKLLSVILITGSIILSNNPGAVSHVYAQNQNKSKFSKLSGPYLGQKPPGKIPEIFAPGILSTYLNEGKICFSPDGKEVFFSVYLPDPFRKGFLFYSHIKNSYWTQPKQHKLTVNTGFGYQYISPDGKRMFFYLIIPGDDRVHLGYIEKKGKDWGTVPKKVKFYGNDFFYQSCSFPSVAANGNLYFQMHPGGDGNTDIYMSKFKNGIYMRPEKLNNSVNTVSNECHPCITPDESYIVFDAYGRGIQKEDGLFVSFRDKSGNWTGAKNLGENINSGNGERRAFVSHDGKYLFYTSKKKKINMPEVSITLEELLELVNNPGNGQGDIYWVDAKVIEDLKPDHLK